jgi:hypothetical protein
MIYLCERPGFCVCLPLLLGLAGCGPKPECDSFETRSAVLKVVSDDHGNRLGVFAAKDSSANKNSSDREGAKPLYALGEKMVTTSMGQDGRTLKCSGAISATVGETKASKEIEYTVQQAKNGDLSVSVTPFQF